MKSEAKPSQTSIRLGKNSSEANRKSDATRIVYSDSKNFNCDTDNHSQYGLSNVKKDKSRQNITNNSGEIFDKMSLGDGRMDQSSTNAYGLIGIHTTFEQLESSSPCDTPDPNMKQAPYEPITLNNDQDLSTLYSPINKIIIPGK